MEELGGELLLRHVTCDTEVATHKVKEPHKAYNQYGDRNFFHYTGSFGGSTLVLKWEINSI